MQLKHFPTSSVTVLTDTKDTDGADYFCKINGLPGCNVVGIAPEDVGEDKGTAQWYAIERQRAKGPINLVVTAYKEVYERCLMTHQPVLLFGRRGSLGSLDSTATWGQLHDRVVRTRIASVEDA